MDGLEHVVCCVGCRLLQFPDARCAACGAPDLVDVTRRLDRLLAPRLGASVDEGSTFSSPLAGSLAIMGLAFGLGSVFGYLASLLWGGAGAFLGFIGSWGLALGVASVLHSRRLRLTHLSLAAAGTKLLPGPGDEHAGVVERSGKAVDAPITGRSCVAATLSIVPRPGEAKPPYFWVASNPGFWLVADDGRRIHVAGPLWIDGAPDETAPAGRTSVAVALPPDTLRDAAAEERRLEAGARIVLSGVAKVEMVTGVAYRDAEELVARGRPGQPLVAQRV